MSHRGPLAAPKVRNVKTPSQTGEPWMSIACTPAVKLCGQDARVSPTRHQPIYNANECAYSHAWPARPLLRTCTAVVNNRARACKQLTGQRAREWSFQSGYGQTLAPKSWYFFRSQQLVSPVFSADVTNIACQCAGCWQPVCIPRALTVTQGRPLKCGHRSTAGNLLVVLQAAQDIL